MKRTEFEKHIYPVLFCLCQKTFSRLYYQCIIIKESLNWNSDRNKISKMFIGFVHLHHQSGCSEIVWAIDGHLDPSESQIHIKSGSCNASCKINLITPHYAKSEIKIKKNRCRTESLNIQNERLNIRMIRNSSCVCTRRLFYRN